jgi:hypothetical protein
MGKPMSKPKIALVVNQEEEKTIYLEHLRAYNVDIIVTTNFRDLENLLSGQSYNGIIVDLKTKLSVPRDQKMLAYDLLEHYPVLQSRVVPETGQLQTMPFGKTQRDVSLELFLTNECPNFQARKIRSALRQNIHFNIMITKAGNFDMGDVERTVTLNASRDGCFIITSSKWQERTSVPFIIKELDIKIPIVGEICWQVKWGREMKVPGIGLRYEDIQSAQYQELIEKYYLP